MSVMTVEAQADDCAHWAAVAPLTEGVLTPFGVIDPHRLSQDGCLDLLVGLERLKSWADAQQTRVLARLVEQPDPVPAAPRHRLEDTRLDRAQAAQLAMREEVASALRWSFAVAAERADAAAALAGPLSDTLDRLEDGAIPYADARTLVRATRDLDDRSAAAVQERVLARAPEQTPSEFRTATRRAVAAIDPRGAAEKHEAAATQRRVGYQPDDDAMAWIHACLPAPDAQTVMTAVQAVADKARNQRPGDGRTADQLRADALVDICSAVLSGSMPDSLSRWHGRRPNVNVTVALSTLTGADEQPAHLDGYGAIPAELARRMAADPTGTWRRLVTDPVGRLLDYGRTTYRPPADLTDFVIARDRTCQAPGCHRAAQRTELDHVLDWARGGTTCPDNLAPACPRHHHLKHDTPWRAERAEDGGMTWTSPTGRRHHRPAEPLPIDHTSDPPPF